MDTNLLFGKNVLIQAPYVSDIPMLMTNGRKNTIKYNTCVKYPSAVMSKQNTWSSVDRLWGFGRVAPYYEELLME